MKNIVKKSINYGLKTLAILALVLIFTPFNQTSAEGIPYVYGPFDNTPHDYSNYRPTSYQAPTPVYYVEPAPTYVASPAPTPIVYSSATNPNAPAATPKADTKTKTDETAKTDEATSKYGELAANVLFGSKSFMPAGLTGWIFFAVLVFGTVLLVRKVYGGSEKYHAIPMKHK